MSLAQLLLEHPSVDDETLVFTIDDEFSRAAVITAATAVAAALEPLVGPRQPVAVVADGYDAFIGMFGSWLAGAVFVPVNPRQPEEAIKRSVDRIDAAAVIDCDGVRARDSSTRYDTDAALVLFTSGTTGEPTPIVHHHAAYLEIIDRVLGPLSANRDRSRPPSPNLIAVSMALNAGIYNALFGLRAGAPLVLMDRFDPAEFAQLVRTHGVRSTVLPPAAIAMLNDDESVTDLAPLKYVRSITAPLSPFHARRFTAKFGSAVLNGYGQAELGEVIGWTATDAKERSDMIGAVGRAHAGVELRIDDPDANGVGELLVRPPVAPAGGVRTALGDRLGADGFVRTGDLARLDDGFVWIEGRVGDVINRGGNKIFPDEVEEVLRSAPGVDDVAVVGHRDDRLGEVPVAHVVGAANADELDALCRAELAAYKVPVRFERIDALPRNAAGKVLRRELQPKES